MRPQHKTFTQQHRPKKNLLIGGIQSVIDTMRSGVQLERIYLQNTISREEAEELKKATEQKLKATKAATDQTKLGVADY